MGEAHEPLTEREADLIVELASLRQEIERLRKIEEAAQKWENADAAYDPDDEYEMTLYAEWVHAATDLRSALAPEPTND